MLAIRALAAGWLAALAVFAPPSHAAEPAAAPPLGLVYRVKAAGGQKQAAGAQERWSTPAQYGFDQLPPGAAVPAFRAVLANRCPRGLIPIFAVEKQGRLELRRLPPKGQENITEPLFFALPPADEPEAALLSGPWKCEAIRGNGSTVFPDFEIIPDQSRLAARFDQGSEYRFAYITSGLFSAGRIELSVEYINDRYQLTGLLEAGAIQGDWQQLTGPEKGVWKAWREEQEPALVLEPAALANLSEYQSESGPARRFLLETEEPGPGWRRSERPLCRVWKLQLSLPRTESDP